ncbi:MAG: DUF1015 family protein [Rhodocyclaceae bacterium]|nr:DUF1015 family protein [Rhodocyclaceae bacterium]
MTAIVQPFRGLRPNASRLAEVIAPPYDVLSSEEARVQAKDRPWSFLHISKPEIDLPSGTDVMAPHVYAKARENLDRMISAKILERDELPCYYAYRIQMGDHIQTGIVVAASVAAYDEGRIKRHEFTRPDKEDDRVRQIEATNAQTGPVLLACPGSSEVEAILERATQTACMNDATATDGIVHQLWPILDAECQRDISALFEAMPALYIADGHHRSAAASRVAASCRTTEIQSSDFFLAVVFPHNQMKILDYNRVVRDLNGLTDAEFLTRIATSYTVTPSDMPVKPTEPGEVGLYLSGNWIRLRIHPRLISTDPVARLDVSLLSDHLLGPVLGITDLRRDKRIDFVGGIRGLPELEKRVDSGEMAAAFAMFPTRMEDLMAVADTGQVMPPKSTWFEPKLADGMVSHVLD